MLCTLCSAASKLLTGSEWEEFKHQSTYSALNDSASAGCQLCRFLKQALLMQYAYGPWRTLQSAEEYQFAVDQESMPSAFILLNCRVEIDSRFAPFQEGSVGFHFIRRYDDDDISPIGEIWTFIALETRAGSAAQSLGQVIGAPVPSEWLVSVGQQWILDCKKNHGKLCSGGCDTRLPTRVLDVGPPSVSEDVRLAISNGLKGRYATLSHRWGNSRPVTLTKEKYQEFLRNIPFISLPRTFQDAVTVTRKLGIRYLWIDSLCILQDCKDDWEKAVIEMPQIYRHGEVNICGPAAASCDAGFLHPRQVPTEWLDIEWHGFGGNCAEMLRLIYKGPMEDHMPPKEREAVLSTRGWILQERLLCRRMLYFGSQQMYWECNTHANYESLHFPVPHDYQIDDEVAKFSFNTIKPSSSWLRTWYELVKTYSEMELTEQTDKFPAISALASAFSEILDDKYVAGLWRSDLRRGLTWHIPEYIEAPERADQCGSYIAPSWSWASTTSQVAFCNIVYDLHASDTELVDPLVVPQTANPFGELTESRLTLNGSPFTARVKKCDHKFVPGRRVWKAFLNAANVELGTFYPDHAILEGVHNFSFLEVGQFTEPTVDKIAIAIGKSLVDPAKYCRQGLLVAKGSSDSAFDQVERGSRTTFELI